MKLTHEFEELSPRKAASRSPPGCHRPRFETLEHGGEFPDAIRLTDAEGRSCLYVPVKVAGKVVNSKKFTLEA
jgi:hypothetical protein